MFLREKQVFSSQGLKKICTRYALMKIGLLGMGTVGGGVRELAERLPDVKIARILERVHTRP